MKKVVSTVLVCVLLIGVMLTLVSCGKQLSGTYKGLLGFDLKFSGNKVTAIVGDKELTGTYEIEEKDDKMTISFDFVDEKDASDDEAYVLGIIDKILGAPLSFKEDGKKITIGFLVFEKK
jgi:hypothetical protein